MNRPPVKCFGFAKMKEENETFSPRGRFVNLPYNDFLTV